jgi:TetR/AcrR family transcriptional regulator, cholesterol catabolism regulator
MEIPRRQQMKKIAANGTFKRTRSRLRETIRDRAGELFAKVGFGNITVEDIANHLGISKAIVYYHFASKEEIYYEFLFLAHQRALEGIKSIVVSPFSPQEKLKKAIEYHVDMQSFGLSKPVMMDLHWRFVFPKKLATPIKRLRNQYDKNLRKIIEEGIAENVIVDVDPKVIAFIICGAINFLPIWYDPKGPLSQAQIKEMFTTCLTGGLFRQDNACNYHR